MDVLLRASELERQGRSIMHLEVGQPQSGAPAKVVAEAAKALVEQRLAYTEALGILPLRRRISQHYRDVYGVEVAPECVAVTTGSRQAMHSVARSCKHVAQQNSNTRDDAPHRILQLRGIVHDTANFR
eukprot:TRINITY_DN1261_c0_g1_i1.p5 TRINITY_DN1261_c0_g1~~TRINITY_DN1261_c0_g1_i1.p5  ORF type:complete len:128 (-),score=26.25 TRINITY_DN1261_c0_g1_i1:1168-1551(-)